jgi:hypothetical protein
VSESTAVERLGAAMSAGLLEGLVSSLPVLTIRDVMDQADRVLKARTAAENQALRRELLNGHRLIAILVRKLGGTVQVTGEELAGEDSGTLVRTDAPDGFWLAVADS